MSDSQFARVASANTKRSSFRRPSNHKTTLDGNQLIPVFVDEVLPGDTFKLKASQLCRLATPLKPSMDNMYMDVHYFFVPSRLVWDNWEKFMGAQENPGDSTDFLIPTFSTADVQHQSIFDYMGIPPLVDGLEINALPFRAYNLIYNEWYRDQNLIDSVLVERGDSDSMDNYHLLKRAKRHDYFTSALPFPQKGEAVSLSLAGNAPVEPSGTGQPLFSLAMNAGGRRENVHMRAQGNLNGPADVKFFDNAGGAANSQAPVTWSQPNLIANMDDVTAVTINQLRQAFQLQKFLERDARSGTRYIEVIKAHFNVTNPDFRLQRPEYLGGTHNDVNMTTIAQTSGTFEGVNETPQGNLAAMGTVAGSNHVFNKSFTEHGYIIGIASVYTDITYQQGLNRMWSRETRYDFYWPSFAHLGEQEIFNREIFAQGNATDNQLFGYQERYAEYRYSPNRVSGLFRSNAAQSLDVWHYSEDFEDLPVLSQQFIENNSPIKRNSAVPSEPDFICDFDFNLTCVRPMPMYGTPGFVDHF